MTDRPGWTRSKSAILVLLVAAVGYLMWSTVATQVDANRAGEQASAVAQPVDALCAQGGPVAAELSRRGACTAAAEVQQQPAVPAVGEPVPGPAGRGIAGTSIVAGRLLIAYTDGTTEDKGAVVGESGPPGPPGEHGRGVMGTAILAGRLVLSYSDSTTEDVGQVVGAPGADGDPGRGVASVDALGGRLVVTYTDGMSADAGPLPAGTAGRGVQRAEVIDCRWRVTYTDGTTEDAGAACTTQTVTAPAPTTTASTPAPPLLPLGR